jgi:hypothetical protein
VTSRSAGPSPLPWGCLAALALTSCQLPSAQRGTAPGATPAALAPASLAPQRSVAEGLAPHGAEPVPAAVLVPLSVVDCPPIVRPKPPIAVVPSAQGAKLLELGLAVQDPTGQAQNLGLSVAQPGGGWSSPWALPDGQSLRLVVDFGASPTAQAWLLAAGEQPQGAGFAVAVEGISGRVRGAWVTPAREELQWDQFQAVLDQSAVSLRFVALP